MKKRIISFLLLILVLLSLSSCIIGSKDSTVGSNTNISEEPLSIESKSDDIEQSNSNLNLKNDGNAASFGLGKTEFGIRFIDVGQGDAALVKCDGCYMLIDGGSDSKQSSENVLKALKAEGLTRLNILAISHMHDDHIGGLQKAISRLNKIDLTISNTDNYDSAAFRQMKIQLNKVCPKITVPSIGTKYKLGSATIEVVDNQNPNKEDNASLVLLITYKKNRFLFTGDIQEKALRRVSDKYGGYSGKEFKVDVIKMPHHGAYYNSLYVFLRTFMPEYIVISVGEGNQYGHPDKDTLNEIKSYEKSNKAELFRTDKNGDIIVKSNGHKITVTTLK